MIHHIIPIAFLIMISNVLINCHVAIMQQAYYVTGKEYENMLLEPTVTPFMKQTDVTNHMLCMSLCTSNSQGFCQSVAIVKNMGTNSFNCLLYDTNICFNNTLDIIPSNLDSILYDKLSSSPEKLTCWMERSLNIKYISDETPTSDTITSVASPREVSPMEWFVSRNGPVYVFHENITSSYAGAFFTCASKGTRLATIKTTASAEFLANQMPYLPASAVHVGAQIKKNIYQWIDDSEIDDELWGDGEPSNKSETATVMIQQSPGRGTLQDEYPHLEANFICEMQIGPDAHQCSGDNSTKFQVINQSQQDYETCIYCSAFTANRTQAQTSCMQTNKNAYLAYVYDQISLNGLATCLANNPTATYYIGMQYDFNHKQWYQEKAGDIIAMSDQSDLFAFPEPSRGQAECLHLSQDSKLYTNDCDQQLPYFCEVTVTSCQELAELYPIPTGIYELHIHSITYSVICDMDTEQGGWTIIMQRDLNYNDGGIFKGDEDYYENAFGDVFDTNYWLGLTNIKTIMAGNPMMLWVDLDTDTGLVSAKYTTFNINMFSNALDISGYTGTAGDGMSSTESIPFSNGGLCPDAASWWVNSVPCSTPRTHLTSESPMWYTSDGRILDKITRITLKMRSA